MLIRVDENEFNWLRCRGKLHPTKTREQIEILNSELSRSVAIHNRATKRQEEDSIRKSYATAQQPRSVVLRGRNDGVGFLTKDTYQVEPMKKKRAPFKKRVKNAQDFLHTLNHEVTRR